LQRPPDPPRDAILLKAHPDRAEIDRFLEELERSRRAPEASSAMPEFCCSFCDKHRREVTKLISGPRVFICDGCVGEAVGVMSHVLRA
jgi:hypothetical protein